MDKTEEQDRVVPLPLPGPDPQNPLPIVLAKDGTVVLSYVAFVARKNVHVVATFHYAFGHRLGPPDSRSLSSHPIATRGLKPDGAFEVKGSSWASDAFAGKGKHYVFTFRDETFECVAEGYGSEEIKENDDTVRVMARRLYR
jgi:hypothetical protein